MSTVLPTRVAAMRFLDTYPSVTIYRDQYGDADTCDMTSWLWALGLPMPSPLADDDYSPEMDYCAEVMDLVTEHLLPRNLTYLVPTALESYALTNQL